MDNLEKRIANCEIAIIGIVTLLEDSLAPALASDLHGMTQDFFESSDSLGGFTQTDNAFYSKETPDPLPSQG